ncbi:hypothetical protein [Caproiciproducens sp. CPB-2]|uniref:hypothetical protein n=1 Tax=Caproiciproducens sp. CPB-2 TaxID=3030017 RepID=UPI0023DC2AA0|nr:hypothetical protein [Caproiciproducens sp. CPB-2]MDF1496312.1 hypothetical protein [Caproiciproducens sp. CPB-2]
MKMVNCGGLVISLKDLDFDHAEDIDWGISIPVKGIDELDLVKFNLILDYEDNDFILFYEDVLDPDNMGSDELFAFDIPETDFLQAVLDNSKVKEIMDNFEASIIYVDEGVTV